MLSKDKIKELSRSAKIKLKDEELELFADDLSDMLAFINLVHEIDFEREFHGFNDKTEDLFSDDEVKESKEEKDVFSDTKNRKEKFSL